jgi:hypothetical protein
MAEMGEASGDVEGIQGVVCDQKDESRWAAFGLAAQEFLC